jgi:hypothetical protein
VVKKNRRILEREAAVSAPKGEETSATDALRRPRHLTRWARPASLPVLLRD